MSSFRVLGIAASVALAVSLGFSDDLLKQSRGSSGQGGRPRQDSRPSTPSRNDQGPRPRDNGPRNDQRPPPRDNGPRNDQRPPPRDNGPQNDQRPPPRDNGPRLPDVRPKPQEDRKPIDVRPKPQEDRKPIKDVRPKPTQDPGQRPPRQDDNRPPRINDDLLKPRPGGGNPSQGSTRPDVKPGSDTRPKPVQNGDRPRDGGDDLLRPRPGSNPSGPGQGQRDDRRPTGQIQIGASPGRTQPLGNIGTVQDTMLGRRGGSVYGGQVSNQNRDGRNSRPVQIDRAPIDIFRGSLQNQVRREDRVRLNHGWRSGYYHYYRNWCDDFFWFGYYVFDPFAYTNCFVSPWYYYPHLPGYISGRRVTIININLSPWYGTYYNWNRPYGYNTAYDYSPLDYALDDITRSFERADYRALRRLIPYNDRVAIFVDGEYTYSMEPEDFENFMYDAIESTKTLRYEITRVERRGREAQIEARHEYEDPWGRRTTVYHSYRLEQDRGNYVITRFGTSFSRNW